MNRFAITTIMVSMFFTLSGAQAMTKFDDYWLGVGPAINGFTLRAISTGCTKKSDFSFEVNSDSVLKVDRIRPDRCRAKPHTVEFRYSFEELGITDDVYIYVGSKNS